MPKLSSKLVHHLLEYHGVDVLAEHVEEEPVADEGLLHDGVDHFSPYQSEADVEEVRSHLRAQDDDEPIQDDQRAQKRQQDEPEEEKWMISWEDILKKKFCSPYCDQGSIDICIKSYRSGKEAL